MKAFTGSGFRSSGPGPACRQADARRKIFRKRGVLIVRRSEWKIEATPQIGFFGGIKHE